MTREEVLNRLMRARARVSKHKRFLSGPQFSGNALSNFESIIVAFENVIESLQADADRRAREGGTSKP